jgi:hypothetical protein
MEGLAPFFFLESTGDEAEKIIENAPKFQAFFCKDHEEREAQAVVGQSDAAE